MKKCFDCNIEYSEKDLFCEKCGKKLEECVKCPKCHNIIKENDHFCKYCGHDINEKLEEKKEEIIVEDIEIDKVEIIKKNYNKFMKWASIIFGALLIIGTFNVIINVNYFNYLENGFNYILNADSNINFYHIITFMNSIFSIISLNLALIFAIIGTIKNIISKEANTSNRFIFTATIFYIMPVLFISNTGINYPFITATLSLVLYYGTYTFYIILFLIPTLYAIDKIFLTFCFEETFSFKKFIARFSKYLIIILNIILLVLTAGNYIFSDMNYRYIIHEIPIYSPIYLIVSLLLLIYILISCIVKVKSKESSKKILVLSAIDNFIYICYFLYMFAFGVVADLINVSNMDRNYMIQFMPINISFVLTIIFDLSILNFVMWKIINRKKKVA